MELAVDANVLLSAVIGGRARLIVTHPGIDGLVTTAGVLSEIEEYAPRLAEKHRLPADTVLLAVAALPVRVIERSQYSRHIAEAERRIGARDADDVDLLALALRFRIPIWSNDRDFEDARVTLFTTEKLLRKLDLLR